MRPIKTLFFALGLFLLTASSLFAGKLGEIKIEGVEGEPYMVKINLKACQNDATAIGQAMGETFLVQIFAYSDCTCEGTEDGAGITDCDPQVPFEMIVEVPPCNSFSKVDVQLYDVNAQAKIPELGLVSLADSMSVEQELEVRQQACCNSQYDACMDACDENGGTDEEIQACKDACQNAYQECLKPTTEFGLSCHPETLNMKSHGRWITCILTETSDETGSGVEGIDPSSLELSVGERSMAPDWYNMECSGALMMKFNRQELQEMIMDLEEDPTFPMTVPLELSGELYDGGKISASDEITAINPGADHKKRPKPKGAGKAQHGKKGRGK